MSFSTPVNNGKNTEVVNDVAAKNNNCLCGMACPSCHSLGDFTLMTRGYNPELMDQFGEVERELTPQDVVDYPATWSDNGSTDTYGDTEFVDGDASCHACGFAGHINQFYIKNLTSDYPTFTDGVLF